MIESSESNKQLALLGHKMDTLIEEVSSLRRVVVGNGDSNSLVSQVHTLKLESATAKDDRAIMNQNINKIGECVTNMEKEGLKYTPIIDNLVARQDELEAVQEEHGVLIAAFRNRVIGIVAVLSLLAGAGAGFVAAARLLSAAVP